MNFLCKASLVAILGLSIAGCLDESNQSTNSTAPTPEHSITASEYDSIKLSEDDIALVPRGRGDNAARPYMVTTSDGILRSKRWEDGTVIHTSLHGPYPSGAKAIIDTAMRYWMSLIDPDASYRISFQMVADNDPNAQLKIDFSSATHPKGLALAATDRWIPADASPIIIRNAWITFYAKTNTPAGTLINDWTLRELLFNAALHELGHILGLGDETASTYANEVMFGTLDRNAPRRYFGTDDVQTINELFHGSRSTYSKWIPIFSGGDTGWAAAKSAYAAKRRNYKLLGIALPTTDNRAGLTTLYRFKRTNGTFALWDEQNSSTLTCPDNGVAPGQAGQAFVKVFANTEGNNEPTTGLLHGNSYLMTHRPDATVGWTNVFVNAVQPNFGCQRQVGWIPSLKAE